MFKQFCIKMSKKGHLTLPATADLSVPQQYMKKVDVVVTNIKKCIDNIDNVTIPYIQNIFTEDETEAKLDGGNLEIPDGILEELSKRIFEYSFNDLTDDNQAIIKTLSAYICIL